MGAQTSLIPAGAVWKYLDNGSDQGAAWRGPSFSDAVWASGAAQLGYGDGDEATVVSYGPNSSAKYITTYFRRTFSVANPAAFTSLTLRVKRDDGVVVYLNGTEVYRNNMPAGDIAYTTLASSAAGDDGATWQQATVGAGGLVAGDNLLAAEIHQSSGTSSDISFDLELIGNSGLTLTRGPYLQMGTPGSLIVRWRTDAASDSRVKYGPSPSDLSSITDNPTLTAEHVVQLTGLTPGTTYYYSIGSTATTLAGGDPTYFFVMAPAANSQRSTRIWVLGDSGTADANAAAVRDAYYSFTGTRHTDLWLMLGDNAYNSGTDSEYQAAVYNMYPAMLRKSVLWPTLGNHDTAGSTNPPADLPYFNMFSLPTAAEAGGLASGTEKYYSFDFGNIHFVCLDSMSSSRSTAGAMYTWLQNDLAANTKDWLIAFWHHPPYSKGSHNSDSETALIEMRTNFLPLLEQYGVDLVLAGHSHSYERSYLLDGHYGLSSTFSASHKKDGGSGREDGSGAYRKPVLGPSPHDGAVYAVAGSSGKTSGGTLNHPAMFISLNNLGSMILDINGNRLDAKFLRETGAIADYFTIIKGTAPNSPPAVSITSPANGASFTAPANITISADATDSDGTITKVDFYQGSTLLGTDTASPYSFTWTGAGAGAYTLTARATDNLGAETTSAAVNITVAAPPAATTLVAAGSLWKYLDNGSNQGTAWTGAGFSDSAWKSGAAQLGYGDGDEATVVGFGPNSKKKYITTYFRKPFSVTNPGAFTSLKLRLLRDDGAVVYINGVEVARSNMPGGAVSYTTKASSEVTGAAENTFYEFTVSPSTLVAGSNVIAVEIHQVTGNNPDISFDLELLGLP
jgi:hypothetical protein